MDDEKQFDIAVLLPTRGRTDALKRSVISLVNRAVNLKKVQILFGFDDDDAVGVEYFTNSLKPELDKRNVNYRAISFERMGYARLNEYANGLAEYSSAHWFFLFNDDAIMDTAGWDREITKYNGQFKLLAVHTHHDHPYSIFPIIPWEWYDVTKCISRHQMSDAYLSQLAFKLDIWQRINIHVTHDRFDLTGNNKDATYNERVMFEGKPNESRDFHHPSQILHRMNTCEQMSKYMKKIGLDTTWWENVKTGKQDPWTKLKIADVNNQMVQFNMKFEGEPKVKLS